MLKKINSVKLIQEQANMTETADPWYFLLEGKRDHLINDVGLTGYLEKC